jgi:hypothetical protein
MVECRGGSCFPPEAFERLWVAGYICGEKLQRDETAKLSVLGLIHHTHSAAAQLLNDAVMRDGLTEQRERHSALG